MNALYELHEQLGIGPDTRLSVLKLNGQGPQGKVITAAEAWAVEFDPETDYYVGVNTIRRDARGRGTADDVTAIHALVADLDVKDGGLPDEDTARQVINELSGMLGCDTAAVVDSGGGLHPYWATEDPEDPAWRELLPRFGLLVAKVAKRWGGNVDNTYDLARVWRWPGSVNYKYDTPMPVSMDYGNSRPLSVVEVAECLDAYAIPAHTETVGEPVPATGWEWAETDCPYTRRMVKGWATDTPTRGRHPWLVSQCVRLALRTVPAASPSKATRMR